MVVSGSVWSGAVCEGQTLEGSIGFRGSGEVITARLVMIVVVVVMRVLPETFREIIFDDAVVLKRWNSVCM